MSLFEIGLTDHLEGPRDRPSAEIFDEVSDLVRLADDLGVRYAWFSEHHAHAHHGHLPAPLLFALYLAGQTTRIRLGTAIICLNLHHPLAVAEQVAVADMLAGGTGLVAANRPVFVGPDDASAFARAEPALRTLWHRFRDEGKIPAGTPEPESPADLCAHPINFVVGGLGSVARQLRKLHAQVPFDVANVEVRWTGLTHEQVRDSLRRLMEDVVPRLEADPPAR